MVKSIIKEIFIILLLVIVILLGLAILFYDYNPTSKKIPSSVEAYSLPEEMEEELSQTIQAMEQQSIVKTYSVTAEDLYKYQQTDDYEKGKINPFGEISSNSGIENNTVNNSKDDTDVDKENGTSQGKFFNTIK